MGIFKGISSEELERMLHCFSAVTRKFKEGDNVLDYEKEFHNICVVLSGHVEVTCLDYEGNLHVLDSLEGSGVFGEVFSKPVESLAYTAVARTDCEVLFISYNRAIHPCEHICSHHTNLINNLFVLAAEKAQVLTKRITILSRKTLRQKLMMYLEYTARELNASVFELPMTLSELAIYLAVDRSAMMREIAKMRADGLISSEGRRFEILQI